MGGSAKEDSTNNVSLNTSKYERRNRKQTEKGEKLAKERSKKRRRSSGKKRTLCCETCDTGIHDEDHKVCSECHGMLHNQCTVVLNEIENYCSKCVSQLKWDDIDDYQVPRDAVTHKWRGEWRSPRTIEQNRLKALARLQEKRNHQQLIEATVLLEQDVKDQLEKLKQSPLVNQRDIAEIEMLISKDDAEERNNESEKQHGKTDNSDLNDGIESDTEGKKESSELAREHDVAESEMVNGKEKDESEKQHEMIESHDLNNDGQEVISNNGDQEKKTEDDLVENGSIDISVTVQHVTEETAVMRSKGTITVTETIEPLDAKEAEEITAAKSQELLTVSEIDKPLDSTGQETIGIVQHVTDEMIEETAATKSEEMLTVTEPIESLGGEEENIAAANSQELLTVSEIDKPRDGAGQETHDDEIEGTEEKEEEEFVIKQVQQSYPNQESNYKKQVRFDIDSDICSSSDDEASTEYLSADEFTTEEDEDDSCEETDSVERSKSEEEILINADKFDKVLGSNELLTDTEISPPISDLSATPENLQSISSAQNMVVGNTGNEKSPSSVNNISPVSIPPEIEGEYFIEHDGSKEFTCKLCTYTSTSKSGIKNHLTRTHKIQKTLMHSPKEYCKKCKKEIKKKIDAGQCIECKGMEHYRCTQTGKQHKEQYLNGLPFKCVQCCLPGILILPEVDVRNTAKEVPEDNQKNPKTAEEELPDTSQEKSKSHSKTNTETSNCTSKQLKKDNVTLTQRLKELMEKEGQTTIEMKLLRVDNIKLNDRIQELEKENETLLSKETDIRAENKSLSDDLKLLKIENNKIKEVALEVQRVLTTAIKDANLHTLEKDQEIERLIKTCERLKAENVSYKELLSPEMTHQRSLQCREQSRSTASDSYKGDNGPFDIAVTSTDHERVIRYKPAPPDTLVVNSDDDEEDNDHDVEEERGNRSYHHDTDEERDDRSDYNPPPAKEFEKQKVRYCHFYNRSGCNTPNCRYLHDLAPLCEKFQVGRCNRKLCMYRHEKKGNFQDGHRHKPPDQPREYQNGWESGNDHHEQQQQQQWIPIGERTEFQMHQEPSYTRELPHHRYRYTREPNSHHQTYSQQQFPTKFNQTNNNRVRSSQTYPPRI